MKEPHPHLLSWAYSNLVLLYFNPIAQTGANDSEGLNSKKHKQI